MERYAKYLFVKTAQIVVQSRQGHKMVAVPETGTSSSAWFCLAISDLPEVTSDAKAIAQPNGLGPLAYPLCVEISLMTQEGESMVLETWILNMRDSCDLSVSTKNVIYGYMGQLLKSVICTSRSLPAYRLSRRQGSYVICYKIFSGEPGTSALGEGYQTCQIGQVPTAHGTYEIIVEYRTSMTITHSPGGSASSGLNQCPLYAPPTSGNTPGTNNAASGGTTSANSADSAGKGPPSTSHNLVVHADHFEAAAVVPQGRKNSRVTSNVSDCESELDPVMGAAAGAITSDDGHEQVSFSVASPPKTTSDNIFANYKSNKPRLAAGSTLGKMKTPAFAILTPMEEPPDIEQDSLMKLFSVKPEEKKPDEKAAEEQHLTEEHSLVQDNLQQLTLRQGNMSKNESEDSLKYGFLGMNNPFSSVDTNNDFKVLFKEAKALQQTHQSNPVPPEEQSQSINEQLEKFESDYHEYEQLLRELETSESESEAQPN